MRKMLVWNNSTVEARGSYITFRAAGFSESGKTRIWNVLDEGGGTLGRVVWFGRWRKYAFQPVTNYLTTYEWACLNEIAEFCHTVTANRRSL